MKDVVLLFLFTGLGFPLGAALALFILWMDKQKRPPRHRPPAAIPGGLAIIGIGTNLAFVVLNAAGQNWHQMQAHLLMAAFFALATSSIWVVTRRPQIAPPDRPNYGDDI